MLSQKNKNAFSSIEILIMAVTFIVILGFVFKTVNPLEKFKIENDQKRKNDLITVQQTLERFYKVNGRYPKYSNKNLKYRLIRLDDSIADWGESFIPFLEKLPKDPKTSNYVYFSSLNGQSYFLYASLERGEKDLGTCSNGKACESLTQNEINIDACGGICNYGVSSPNVTP